MTEYWVKMDINRQQALKMLDELADARSKLRKDLQRSRRSAQKALADRGIEVAASPCRASNFARVPRQITCEAMSSGEAASSLACVIASDSSWRPSS